LTRAGGRVDDGVVRPRSHALVLTLALVVAALVALAPAAAGTTAAGEPGATTEDTPVPGQDIIPRPNSGHEPTDAGDRGGALQIAVLVAIVAGVGGVTALAVRDARRSRRRSAAGRQSSGP
jgi:hypothetical protein